MYNDHALLEIIGSLGANTEHTEAVSHDIDFLAIHNRSATCSRQRCSLPRSEAKPGATRAMPRINATY
jgi:hypothetical protein